MSAAWIGGSDRRWRKLRLYVLDRDGFTCQMPVSGGTADNGGQVCGAFATHVDHIVPLAKGGAKYDDRNCRASCASCNLRRGTGRARSRAVVSGWSW